MTVALDPWRLAPLGDLQAYFMAIGRFPLLTPEEEARLATRLREDGDLQAASALVLSHLRLVASVARAYIGYGLPLSDLIQEGNVGLMRAVKRFDPGQGTRLGTYATHWIRSEIHEYVLRNWQQVRIATTKAQRKLFFNLRSMKAKLRHEGTGNDALLGTMTEAQVQRVAHELRVKPEEVREMEVRMAGGDVALEMFDDDTGEWAPRVAAGSLVDVRGEPTRVIEDAARTRLLDAGIDGALAVLDARSRRIVEARYMHDGSGATLQELGRELGVSAERVRQIEVKALRAMRTALADG